MEWATTERIALALERIALALERAYPTPAQKDRTFAERGHEDNYEGLGGYGSQLR
jgi:hypothetical protein